MRLRRRIQLLFVPFVVLLALDLTLDLRFGGELDRSLRAVEGQLNPARLALADLHQALVDQEAGERSFVITGQDDFLVPYRAGHLRTDSRLAELAELFDDDAERRTDVARIRARIDAWRERGAELEIRAKIAGRDAEAVALVAEGTSTELFNAARSDILELQNDLRSQLLDAQERLDVLRSRLSRLRLGSVVMAVGLVLGARWLLVRWITRPVDEIGRAARAVAGGDLDRSIPATGPPDLAELGRDVDDMRRRVLGEIDDANRARASLAKRGMIALTMREELAPANPDLPAGIRLASRYIPAEGVVAGDWFDAVSVGSDRTTVVLGDVSGHGSEAAVFALRTQQLTVAAVRSGFGPAETIRWLSSQLGDTGERFLTTVVIEVDAVTGSIRYASAGHPHLLLGDEHDVELLGSTGPLIGPLPGAWEERHAKLAPGGFVMAYSDGVIEMTDDEGQELGVYGLVDKLTGAGTEPEALADASTADVASRRSPQRDDLTVVVVGWWPENGLDGDPRAIGPAA